MHLVPSLRPRLGRLAAAATAGALLATVLAPVAADASSATTSSTTVLTLSSKATVGIPSSVAPGYHTFVLKESAAQAKKDPRGIQVLQLAKGYTTKQLEKDGAASFSDHYDAAAKKAYTRVLKNLTSLGGVDLESDFTATGDRFTVLLKPGTYVLDNAASEDGAPDVYSPLTVSGNAVGSKPKTVGTITSKEFAYKLVGVKAGKHLYALHDAGAQIHMYQIFRLDKGHSPSEIQQALSSNGPPPAWVHSGGFAGLLTGGQTMYTTLNFSKSSEYLLVCFMPDVKTGAPHVALGMFRLFNVQ